MHQGYKNTANKMSVSAHNIEYKALRMNSTINTTGNFHLARGSVDKSFENKKSMFD